MVLVFHPQPMQTKKSDGFEFVEAPTPPFRQPSDFGAVDFELRLLPRGFGRIRGLESSLRSVSIRDGQRRPVPGHLTTSTQKQKMQTSLMIDCLFWWWAKKNLMWRPVPGHLITSTQENRTSKHPSSNYWLLLVMGFANFMWRPVPCNLITSTQKQNMQTSLMKLLITFGEGGRNSCEGQHRVTRLRHRNRIGKHP